MSPQGGKLDAREAAHVASVAGADGKEAGSKAEHGLVGRGFAGPGQRDGFAQGSLAGGAVHDAASLCGGKQVLWLQLGIGLAVEVVDGEDGRMEHADLKGWGIIELLQGLGKL